MWEPGISLEHLIFKLIFQVYEINFLVQKVSESFFIKHLGVMYGV
jgi:hypothetical protein